jgi:hypothetical protein
MKNGASGSPSTACLQAGLYLCIAAFVVAPNCAWAAEDQGTTAPWDSLIRIRGPLPSSEGVTEYRTLSEYQPGWQPVRIILPSHIEKGRRYPVLYLLPVEPDATEAKRWGSALFEARKMNLANHFGFICVAPVFAQMPWYADHPTDPLIRQESYFLKVIVPLAEHFLPAQTDPAGRLLLGFSKSGNGAFSLLLRYPERFGCAAAWDMPLFQSKPDRWGMDIVYATQENFENYRFVPLVLKRQEELRKTPARRLTLLGYDVYKDQVQQGDEELRKLGVPHFFANDTWRKHSWSSGWFPEAVKDLATCSSELGASKP